MCWIILGSQQILKSIQDVRKNQVLEIFSFPESHLELLGEAAGSRHPENHQWLLEVFERESVRYSGALDSCPESFRAHLTMILAPKGSPKMIPSFAKMCSNFPQKSTRPDLQNDLINTQSSHFLT